MSVSTVLASIVTLSRFNLVQEKPGERGVGTGVYGMAIVVIVSNPHVLATPAHRHQRVEALVKAVPRVRAARINVNIVHGVHNDLALKGNMTINVSTERL